MSKMSYIPLIPHIKYLSDTHHVDMSVARDMLLADIDRRSPEYPIEAKHAPAPLDYESLGVQYDALSLGDKVEANKDLRLFVYGHAKDIAAFGDCYDDLETWVRRVHARED